METAFEDLGGVERLLRCRGLFQTVKNYPDYFRFTVVRDPLLRAASAWGHSQNLRTNSALPTGFIEKSKMRFRKHVYGVRCFEEYLELIEVYLKSDGLYERLKMSENIADFGRSLAWQRLSRFDLYHVLPQVYFTRELHPNVICKVENLSENWKVIQSKVGIEGVNLGWMRSPDAGALDLKKKLGQEFSETEIELVKQIYSDDYLEFNY